MPTTIRSPKGKAIHAVVTDTLVDVSDSEYAARTLCSRDLTGIVNRHIPISQITCVRCADAAARLLEPVDLTTETVIPVSMPSREEVGADVDALTHQALATMEAIERLPAVLSTPEAVSEPPRRVMSPGRARHGRIRAERAAARHAMKERVRELAGKPIPQR